MYEEYRLIYDHHTHTIYSHGKGDIVDNVKVAQEKGIKEIAITDHGPGHHFYGLDKKKLPEMRSKIEGLKLVYPDVKVLLGVEANIISTGNFLDITGEEFKDYDIVLAGYHYGVSDGHVFDNYIASHFGFPSGSKEALEMLNTDMTIGAMYENDIAIITHPGDKGPFNVEEIAKVCAETNTLIEINNKHKHLTVEEIKIAEKYDVKFVVSSDAHKSENVGCVEKCLQRASEAGLDFSRIVNIELR
jgi:putative hydrolase